MSHSYELVLDILSGCRWSCRGCTIDRSARNPFSSDELERLENFMRKEGENGARLGHLEIGPTDIFSCANLEAVFSDAAVRGLIKKFKYIFITSTLLSREDIEGRIALLKEQLAGTRIYLFIPLELRRLEDKRFAEHFFSNLQFFINETQADFQVSEVYLNILDISYFSSLGASVKKELLAKLWKEHGIRLNFNYRLSGDFNDGHYSYASSPKFLPLLMSESRKLDEAYETVDLPEENLNNLKRRGLVFNSNRLFWMPYLGKFTPCLESGFAIEGDEDIKTSLELFETELLGRQSAYLNRASECSECPTLSVCLSRGIIGTMEVYGKEECVVPETMKGKWRLEDFSR